MLGPWMNLGKVVGVNPWPRHACDGELALVDSVSDPIVSGVDGFGTSECDCLVDYSLCRDVIAVDRGR